MSSLCSVRSCLNKNVCSRTIYEVYGKCGYFTEETHNPVSRDLVCHELPGSSHYTRRHYLPRVVKSFPHESSQGSWCSCPTHIEIINTQYLIKSVHVHFKDRSIRISHKGFFQLCLIVKKKKGQLFFYCIMSSKFILKLKKVNETSSKAHTCVICS